MFGPKSTRARLQRIEETILPVLIQITALELLVRLILDVEMDRADDLDQEPLLLLLDDALLEAEAGTSLETTETGEWMRAAAIRAAREIVFVDIEREDVDVEVEVEAANDDGS